MALFVQQDFSPRVLSPRWLAIKCRPNMLLRSRSHVLSILECGLLFREDSAATEQSLPLSEAEWGAGARWLTRGERWISVGAVIAAIAAAPPTINMSKRGACLRACAYVGCVLAVRGGHTLLTRSVLPSLLELLVSYTMLARRVLVCIKQYKFLHRDMGTIAATVDAAEALLCEQQNCLADAVSRCSLALLNNLPWLYDHVSWESLGERAHSSEPVKIHHALLVLQSSFLKNVAMAHLVPPKHAKMTHTDHNERIYWIHSQLLPHIYAEFKDSYASLDRMYRMLRNYGNTEISNTIRSGIALNDSWLYSDVHSGVARATMELKVAMSKCTNLDVFLDNSALQKQPFDIDALNSDLDIVIDQVMMCAATLQNAQIKLKKIQSKLNPDQYVEKQEEKDLVENENVLMIEDKDPEAKDEVFFFIKTEDDKQVESTVDLTTGPGKKEREATRLVLGELKKKLVKREDVMRQREKIALEKTMPELKGNMPEFPRQLLVETPISKGYINKILISKTKPELAKSIKRSNKRKMNKKYCLKTLNSDPALVSDPIEITPTVSKQSLKTHMKGVATLTVKDKTYIITRWIQVDTDKIVQGFSDVSEDLNDIASSSTNSSPEAAKTSDPKVHLKGERKKFSQGDCSSSSDSDFEYYNERRQISLLEDVRRHRVARKKNHPSRNSISVDRDVADEGLRPVEYRFGTGMALASVFQGQNGLRPVLGQEEVFVGDGEVSSDSGNDEGS